MGTIHDDGCHMHALDDEPIFTLLGRDPSAPDAVRHWATLRLALIGSGEKPLDDHKLVEEAHRLATEMVAWRDEATDHREWPTPRWKHPSEKRKVTRLAMDDLDYEVREAKGDGDSSPEGILLKAVINRADDDPITLYPGTIRLALNSMSKRLWAAYERPKNGWPVMEHEWETIMRENFVWSIGNRFRIWKDEDHKNGPWFFSEQDGGRWTGAYPLQNCLQRDMLMLAYAEAKARAVEAIESTTFMGAPIDLDNEVIDFAQPGPKLPFQRYTLDAKTETVDRMVKDVSKSLVLSKLAVGLRQLVASMQDINKTYIRGVSEQADTLRKTYDDILNQISAYATEAQQAIGPEPSDEQIDAVRDRIETYRKSIVTMERASNACTAEHMRDQIAQMFEASADQIYEMSNSGPFHSVSQNALTTYASNLQGWARQIKDLPVPSGCADLGRGQDA